MTRNCVSGVLLAVSLGLVFAWPLAYGQTQLATLVGTVKDSSGAVVPGAAIRVTNTKTGVVNTAITNESGDYVVPSLPAAVYDIEAELTGFKKVTVKDLTLQIAQKARVDLTLAVGEVSEAVTVEGQAPLINSETAEMGQVINNRTVTELPLNGREFIQLVQLAPGANGGPPGAAAGVSLTPGAGNSLGTTPGTAALNGATTESIGYLLDGGENTDKFQHPATIRPSIDVIQEFKVQDKLMSAEFGGSTTGVVSAITKSGTNRFQGTAWNFLRNDVLDARSFFDTQKPIRRRNQFGAVFGGPIMIPKLYDGKNRSFFLVNYEGTRFRSASQAFGTVPTTAMVQGDFSGVVPAGQLFDPYSLDPATGLRVAFPGNRIPTSRFNPTSNSLLQYFPAPNTPSTESDPMRLANNYSRQLRLTQDVDQYLIRIDHNLTEKDRLYGRFANGDDLAPTEGLLPLGNTDVEAHAWNFIINYTRIFSPSTVNEAKFVVNRRRSITAPDSLSDTTFNERHGFDSRQPGVPPLSFTGLTGLGSNANIFDLPNTEFNVSDSLSIIRGAHTFKAGFKMERIGMNNAFAGTGGGGRAFNGNYTRQLGSALNSLEGRSWADYLLGVSSSIGGLNIDVSADRHRPRFANYSGFFQDDWKVSNRLTLNLGLRYDLFLPVVVTNGRAATFFDFSTGQLVYPEDAPFPADCCAWPFRTQSGLRGTSTDYNNFGPRFGFAYRVGGGTKTVLRGGYGLFYDPGLLNVAFNNSQAPPFFKTTTVTVSTEETNPANFLLITKDVAPANVPLVPPVGFKAYKEKTETGMMQQWALILERELNNSTVAAVTYVGWKTDHFLTDNTINMPPPGPGNPQSRRPYPLFASSIVQMDNSSATYHGLNAKLEQRFSKGLSYLAAFTWGHTIGNLVSENGSDIWVRLQHYDNLRLERGNVEYDVRTRFVFSTVYELPFARGVKGPAGALLGGWQVGGIWTAQGGWPLTARVGADLLNQGSRASLYANTNGTTGTLPDSEKTPLHWFNTSAFSVPAQYTYGNVGRGTLRTDGIANLDLSLSKNFQFTETLRLQFRSEFFNLANHATFGVPTMFADQPDFGSIHRTFNNGRQIQFGLKLFF
jgi:hypothetical protein